MVKGMYKVYINDEVLQLIPSTDVPFILLKDNKQKLVSFDDNSSSVKDSITELETGQFQRIVIHSEDLERLWKHFLMNYYSIEAAGGLVLNKKNEMLAIFRRKHWDLPKGKMEEGEKKRETALREVKEECGVKKLELVAKIGTTYHAFGTPEKRKLKISHWYLMQSDDQKLTPQKEEDIEKAVWVEIGDFLLNSKPVYPNIIDVVEAHLLKSVK